MKLKLLSHKLIDAGLEDRKSQSQMLDMIAKAFDNKEIAVCEGGTGVGKTLAYLIPALEKVDDETRIVIATATVNLQEQIIKQDLPRAVKITGVPVDAKIAKGRGRYVCLQRLFGFEHQSQGELALFGINQKAKSNEADNAVVAGLKDQFADELWKGDKDALSEDVKPSLWRQLTVDATACSGRRCSYFSDCPYFKAKRQLVAAKVIVTNHDLLLSDIALGTGVLLPPASKTIYIVDEAHHFPQKALSHFQAQTPLLGSISWLKSFSSRLEKWKTHCHLSNERVKRIEKDITTAEQLLEQVHAAVDIYYSELQDDAYLFESVPQALRDLLEQMLNTAKQLSRALTDIYNAFTKNQDNKTLSDYENELAVLGVLIQRNHDLLRTAEFMVLDDKEPIAKWLTLSLRSGSRKPDYMLHSAWVNAAHLLKEHFWDQLENGAVLCSATLRALGSFDAFFQKAGLLGNAKAQSAYFESPFDYQHSVLSIPKMRYLPQGQQSDDFVNEVAQKLPDLFKRESGGVLVLFTSQWMMEQVYGALDVSWQKNIFKQGDQAKGELLKQHKAKVDSGEQSIIFGMQSFAEGVDLPGDYCQHVIITKLPFSVPSTPIEKTRSRWLEAQQQNPFSVHALPEASLRLTQSVGRLLRTANDCGVVSLLDRRVIDKYYGKQLIAALPPFKLEVEP